MVSIGTPLTTSATRVLMLGAGELGKEVVIELQRFGVEVIAADRYADAPAMQVAHRSHVLSMLDGAALRALVEKEKPHLIVPEIEAIATDTLVELEQEGYTVIPSARAARLTMNREGIRRLAAEQLGLKTSPYRFAESREEFEIAIKQIGLPCVVKPIMSSSGKGQSTVHTSSEIEKAWIYAQEGGRTGGGKVIVEGFVDFDYEITMLTVRHAGGTSFCEPVGHRQVAGDYIESWQPHPMSSAALNEAQKIAKAVTDNLGGRGIFGVELFVKGDEVIFSEVSPRPHDTGLVTLISQDLFGKYASRTDIEIRPAVFDSFSRLSVLRATLEKIDSLDEALMLARPVPGRKYLVTARLANMETVGVIHALIGDNNRARAIMAEGMDLASRHGFENARRNLEAAARLL